ncbi:MAG: hypothetical protein ACXABD_22695 [Candidatus Thorarchaeota archaeon]|jgi:hypothetical protein
MKRGKIQRGLTEYTVSCQLECGEVYVLHVTGRKDFETRLRADGWAVRQGRWTCSACVNFAKKQTDYVIHTLFERRTR